MSDNIYAVSFLTERVERLAYESGMHYKESVTLREELEASKKECQELRDALKEAMQEVSERRTEQLANRAGKTAIDASLLHAMMDAHDVMLSGAPVLERLTYALEGYRLWKSRTTQDG